MFLFDNTRVTIASFSGFLFFLKQALHAFLLAAYGARLSFLDWHFDILLHS